MHIPHTLRGAAAIAILAATSLAAEAQTLDVWVMGAKGPAMEELAATFSQETGTDVVVQAIPWGEARTKMSTAIASGQGPDVVQIGLSFLAEWAEAGALLDLSEHLGAHPELAAERFFPASAATMDIDGVMASVPWISDTRVLFYRNDLLAEAGFAAAPASFAELTAAADALAARGDGQYGIGLNVADEFLPLILTWSAGGDVMGANGIDFSSEAFAEAVAFEQSFFGSGATPKRAQPDDEMIAGFKDGSIPMFVSGPYMSLNLARQAPELDGKWSVAPIPAGEASVSLMAGSNLGIFAKSDNVEGALEFIAWLNSDDTQLAWNKATNDLPAVSSALQSLATDPLISVYYQQMQSANTVPLIDQWGAIAQEMKRAIEQVALGDADIPATLSSLASQAEFLSE